jgi:cobaltochelatase CobN
MHILRVDSHSIDGAVEAVDLDQTPADIVALSFADADLSVLAAAWTADHDALPSLRLANLSFLRHPFSVDLYLEKVAARAKFILVRLLGGKDYWGYGVDELSALSRAQGIPLAIVPGDQRQDGRLTQASTVDVQTLKAISSYFGEGGVRNIGACLRFMAGRFMRTMTAPEPSATSSFGLFEAGGYSAAGDAPTALIVFYRAWMLAADTAPVLALAEAMSARGFRVVSAYATSLKDIAALAPLNDLLATERPDVILNLTGFSARTDGGATVLDAAQAPVFQLVMSGGDRRQWAESQRGLSATDLAMNVVLPELDGRILAGAISFKERGARNDDLEFAPLAHQPHADGLLFAADLAGAWTKLRRTPRQVRRVACVLSDYPKAGRTGYAVGLDTPRSISAIIGRLAALGFDVVPTDEQALIDVLTRGDGVAVLTIEDYEELLSCLPTSLVERIQSTWGEPRQDASVKDGAFCFRILRAGRMIVATQPDRAAVGSRKTDYHSQALPPSHGYVAFYLWLRKVERVHAIIHCGTHGTLEWLPGKAVALSENCAPRAVLGPTPLIYPFIVNNPGEAAQAKRRTAAVTIGHLTPPMTSAGAHGAVAELEGLFDEYSEAQALDRRRAERLSDLIAKRAEETGLAEEAGLSSQLSAEERLAKLDSWLCDLKDMRIGEGLHVFGVPPERSVRLPLSNVLSAPTSTLDNQTERSLAACGESEMNSLVAALDGKFVPPGPGGAPSRGRSDVLPTGRNLFGVDPRSVPTRTAWEIGRRTADEILTRYVQDRGDWPKCLVLDLWGSATMRTGGDDLAQAFALLGVRPRWDAASNRVSGFDVLPIAVLGRPRVDVTLRISGLFRDIFPAQIALFDQVVSAVAALDEPPEDNPLAASARSVGPGPRIFGAAPGEYGIGLSRVLGEAAWRERAELAEQYLEASSYAYGGSADGASAGVAFRARVAEADAFVHVQDIAEQDVLSGDAFAEHEGGFASAAAALGAHPEIYRADTTNPEKSKIRTLREDLARALRSRATNPVWLSGQMRHGFRGAAEIAETVDNFFAFAVLTEFVRDLQFDLLFEAVLGDDTVRHFLLDANPDAARAIASKFEEAIDRGLWRCRRNSIANVLTSVRSAA